ncbi:MAG: type II toxin-antitoxin system HicB family antitoxin [Phascolarctobacterium sp.]|nr:type II toxin-antitoxin system HicB family antitoxin [Phascolarctobacterium sp.]
MKNIEYYLKLPYRLEIVPDIHEGGYAASYPELPGCLTCAETLEEVIANALDAKKTWLEAALEDGTPIQEPESIDTYSGQFKLRMPKSLHKQLAEQSKKEGISMNQYCLYLLSQNNALRCV